MPGGKHHRPRRLARIVVRAESIVWPLGDAPFLGTIERVTRRVLTSAKTRLETTQQLSALSP
jgi:hypothetical protein